MQNRHKTKRTVKESYVGKHFFICMRVNTVIELTGNELTEEKGDLTDLIPNTDVTTFQIFVWSKNDSIQLQQNN